MAALATLRAPIDRFFEEVTVNDPAAEKRAARLALLARFPPSTSTSGPLASTGLLSASIAARLWARMSMSMPMSGMRG